MGLFSKKTINEQIDKYFKANNITLKEDSGYLTFELLLTDIGVSIYPYIKIDSNLISFIINVRRITKDENVLKELNAFNLKSKYLKAILKNELIVLEYNFKTDPDLVQDDLNLLISSISGLATDIDNL